jgi:hypothetical protein
LTRASANLDYWPEATIVSGPDIVVSGISLVRLVDVCGTPAVHSGAAVAPDSDGTPLSDAQVAVLVVRVVAATRHACGLTVVQVDARLDNLRLVWSEARLLGRASSARPRMSLVVRRPGAADLAVTRDVIAIELPKDLGVGDLLAIPTRSITARSIDQLHPLTGTTGWRPDPVFANANRERAPWWESLD